MTQIMNLEDRILFVDGEAIVIDKPEGLPVDPPRPQKPTRIIDVDDPAKKKHRHGRPRKTGRPGQ